MCSEKGELGLSPGSGSAFAIQGYVVRSVGVGQESPFQTENPPGSSFSPAALSYSSFQAQAGWLQHDFGHLSVFSKSRWNHWVHKFVIGHLKVSTGYGEGLPEPCSAARTSPRVRTELRAEDSPSLGHFLLIHSHREPRPAGGITSTSSTTPNPTASGRIPMSTCTPCFLLWGKPSLWRWVLREAGK